MKRHGTPAAMVLANGLSRHGAHCWCQFCKTDAQRAGRMLGGHSVGCPCTECEAYRAFGDEVLS